jgi:CheY-like chemotaxis protein
MQVLAFAEHLTTGLLGHTLITIRIATTNREVVVSASSQMKPSPADSRTDKRSTILIAQHNPHDTSLLRFAFSEAGLPHKLLFVHDGQQAIDYLQGEWPYSDRSSFPSPDLLVLDLELPHLDGFEVLRWLKQAKLDHLPVVALSGSELHNSKSRALALGASEYHLKTGEVRAVVQFFKELSEHWLHPAKN